MALSPIKISVTGLEDIRKQLDTVQKKSLNDELRSLIKETAKIALAEMKSNTPVKTGNLRGSEDITYEAGGFRAFVGPNMSKAPYAPYMEYGFHHWISGKFIPGRHYVEKTAIFMQPIVKQMAAKAIETAISKS